LAAVSGGVSGKIARAQRSGKAAKSSGFGTVPAAGVTKSNGGMMHAAMIMNEL
jgi:hypothetical protein